MQRSRRHLCNLSVWFQRAHSPSLSGKNVSTNWKIIKRYDEINNWNYSEIRGGGGNCVLQFCLVWNVNVWPINPQGHSVHWSINDFLCTKTLDTWLSVWLFVSLQHVFCEDCLCLWFDRERTCPLCRSTVTESLRCWKDGTTSAHFQIYWSVFSLLI